uniref:Uncharacterized protein n=1 Tax=Trichogramma kaykai TaxID=54128 RepID=A0ABD2XLK8_9HYME
MKRAANKPVVRFKIFPNKFTNNNNNNNSNKGGNKEEQRVKAAAKKSTPVAVTPDSSKTVEVVALSKKTTTPTAAAAAVAAAATTSSSSVPTIVHKKKKKQQQHKNRSAYDNSCSGSSSTSTSSSNCLAVKCGPPMYDEYGDYDDDDYDEDDDEDDDDDEEESYTSSESSVTEYEEEEEEEVRVARTIAAFRKCDEFLQRHSISPDIFCRYKERLALQTWLLRRLTIKASKSAAVTHECLSIDRVHIFLILISFSSIGHQSSMVIQKIVSQSYAQALHARKIPKKKKQKKLLNSKYVILIALLTHADYSDAARRRYMASTNARGRVAWESCDAKLSQRNADISSRESTLSVIYKIRFNLLSLSLEFFSG